MNPRAWIGLPATALAVLALMLAPQAQARESAKLDWDGWGASMVIAMIAFSIAVVVLVFWLLKGGLGQPGTRRSNESGALEILARRFAEGSISADEYRERRDALREGPS